MRRLPALVAALLLPAAPPLLLGTAVVSAALLVSQAPAQAQSAEAVAKVAQAITVRIEGATQGSGVLVKRDGNRYTVLTAWHVVSGQRPGEELDIFTPDGQRHQLEQGSIKRIGDVDMAVLTFTSNKTYLVAKVGDVKSVSMGNPIWVSGFPLPSPAVPTRLLRFLKGDVIANATAAIPNGYQLLYSNPTLPGMSGGAALSAQGSLVGIHGQGETDVKMSEQQGVAVKTGTNQAVPINHFVVSKNAETLQQEPSHPSVKPEANPEASTIHESAQNSRVSNLISPVTRHNTEDALAMALALYRQGKMKVAYEQASALVSYKAGSIPGLLIKSGSAVDIGLFAEALKELEWFFQWVGERASEYPSAYVVRGRAHIGLGAREAACSDFDAAMRLGDSEAIAFKEKYCS
jgi:V8-like Glu-specific endopeptidase